MLRNRLFENPAPLLAVLSDVFFFFSVHFNFFHYVKKPEKRTFSRTHSQDVFEPGLHASAGTAFWLFFWPVLETLLSLYIYTYISANCYW